MTVDDINEFTDSPDAPMLVEATVQQWADLLQVVNLACASAGTMTEHGRAVNRVCCEWSERLESFNQERVSRLVAAN